MTRLRDVINPPSTGDSKKLQYRSDNSNYMALQGVVDFSMPSVLLNSDFNFLSTAGTTPTTQADGDNFEFIKQWDVVGATAANYTIAPTAYPNNSSIKTGSKYFLHLAVTSFNGDPFYFYQRQLNTVRKYQNRPMTYSIYINNNQSETVAVRCSIYSYFDTGDQLQEGGALYLKPGMNDLTSTINTISIKDKTIGANDYTEFRLNFIDLNSGTADLDIYWVKCEFGKTATPLNVDHYAEEARLTFA